MTGALAPKRIRVAGRRAALEPIEPKSHGEALWHAFGGEADVGLWRFLHAGPFAERAGFDHWLGKCADSADPLWFTIIDIQRGEATGLCALLRMDPPNGVIEVGGLVYGAALRKTRVATEAMYLLASYVFDELGNRRYEWKCNAENDASRRAAVRLGFTYEGMFRQHQIVKGRNRDTAWYSMLDSEWPVRKKRLERWLADDNFDSDGRQKTPLGT